MSSRAAQLVILPVLPFLLVGCACRGGPGDYTQSIDGTTVGCDMVWIAEGNFWMGRTEVTWDEFLAYCDFDEERARPEGVDAVSRPSKPIVPYDRDWGAGQRPAVGMSWNAARQYCEWLSQMSGRRYRLPTEAEWELACGADGFEPLGDHAWFGENSNGRTQEVGTRAPNAHGLYDMLGNLAEYCAGPYHPDEPDRAVFRGGSWKDDASGVTPGSRLGFDWDWILADPNVPPGVWWVPDGEQIGFRVLRCAE